MQAADPIRPCERVQVILHAEHGGSVDGVSLEDAAIHAQLALLVLLRQAEHLGQSALGVEALQALHCARREDHHAVSALATEHLQLK